MDAIQLSVVSPPAGIARTLDLVLSAVVELVSCANKFTVPTACGGASAIFLWGLYNPWSPSNWR